MPELRTIARHAGTVLVGQLAVMAFGVTDTIVAGRHSQQSLAALSVGSAVYISVFVALMGALQALLPAWAELHGAQRHLELGRSVRQAFYLALLTVVAGIAALLFPGALLDWTEVPPSLQGEVRSYLAVLALALPPALLFRMYSTLNQSLGKPLLITWLQSASLVVKVPLTIWFAGARWGARTVCLASLTARIIPSEPMAITRRASRRSMRMELLTSVPVAYPSMACTMLPTKDRSCGRRGRIGSPASTDQIT